jgi:hypothetical protein
MRPLQWVALLGAHAKDSRIPSQLAAQIVACGIPRKVLLELGTIVTPDRLLRWPRRLIADFFLRFVAR